MGAPASDRQLDSAAQRDRNVSTPSSGRAVVVGDRERQSHRSAYRPGDGLAAAFRRLSWRLRLLSAFIEEDEFGHLFLLYPVAMIAGAVWWFTSPADPSFVPILAWGILLVSLLVMTRHAPAARRLPFLFGAFFVGGALSAWLQTARVETVVLDGPVSTTVTARIREVELRDEGRWRYTVDILKTEKPRLRRPPTSALLGLRGQGEAFQPGAIIKGLVRLQPPAGPALPGLNDFAFDSYFKGIGAIGGFMGRPQPVTEAPRSIAARTFAEALASVRSAINRRILSVLPGDTGAFASALVTNDTAAFSKEGLEALRLSGLAHVISISGLHMVLAAGISFIGLRMLFSLFPGFIQSHPVKAYAALGAIVTSGLYLFISGMPVSAVRSFIMLAIAMGGVIAARNVLTLRSVAIAAFVILLLSPSSVLGPSFQMSFGAATALVSGYTLWRLTPMELRRLSGLPYYRLVLPAIRSVGAVMLTSQIAGVATTIFSVTHFHRLTLLGMLGNVAAMPFISMIVMPAGFLSVILMPLGLDWLPLQIMGLGLRATLAVAHFVSSLGGDIVTGQLSSWVLPVVSTAFVLAILPHSLLFRATGAVLFAASLAAVLLWGRPARPDLVVTETADLVSIVTERTMVANTARPSSFIMEQWARALALKRVDPPVRDRALALARAGPRTELTEADAWKVEDAMEATARTVSPGSFQCSGRDWCIGKLANGLLVATFSDFAFQEAACRQADIAIAAAYLRNPGCAAGEAQLFDRNALRKRGALAIYLTSQHTEPASGATPGDRPPFRIVGALDGRDRPWLRHRYYDWRKNAYDRPFDLGQ